MRRWTQSRAGSAILGDAEERAAIRGLRMDSDSASERPTTGPGREEEDVGEETGDTAAEVGGAESLSIKALHWWESLAWPLRQEAFLTILSRDGRRIWARRGSASGEAAIDAEQRARGRRRGLDLELFAVRENATMGNFQGGFCD